MRSTSPSSAWLLITTDLPIFTVLTDYPWAQAKPRSLVVGAVPKASPRQTRSPSCRTWARLPSAVGEKTKEMLKLVIVWELLRRLVSTQQAQRTMFSFPLAERVPCAWIETVFLETIVSGPSSLPEWCLASEQVSAQQLPALPRPTFVIATTPHALSATAIIGPNLHESHLPFPISLSRH